MLLSELIAEAPDLDVTGIKINSREIEPGDAFLCTMGVTADRHDYIEDAASRGAAVAIVSRDVEASIPTVRVPDTNAIEAHLYAEFYGHPERELTIAAVTGTDGKTSVATILQHLIGEDRCGYIGTNGRSCAAFTRGADNTTPGPDKLYQYFREFADAGCAYVSMEASSEASYRGRLDSVTFAVVGFTNLTSEHLNVHGTLENYIESKLKILTDRPDADGTVVLNRDDPIYDRAAAAIPVRTVSYGEHPDADLRVLDSELTPSGTTITYVWRGERIVVRSPLLAAFNVANLSCALLMGVALGFEMEELLARLPGVNIPGRLDMIDEGQDYFVMVDYAHTPNGITRLLEFVRTLPHVRRSIAVIGQAGERDATKRPTVGRIVSEGVDVAIFTLEDPRREPLDQIFADITRDIQGRDNWRVVRDRTEAIRQAVWEAGPGDMVMVLGKGSEDYQYMPGGKIPYSDIEVVTQAVRDRAAGVPR